MRTCEEFEIAIDKFLQDTYKYLKFEKVLKNNKIYWYSISNLNFSEHYFNWIITFKKQYFKLNLLNKKFEIGIVHSIVGVNDKECFRNNISEFEKPYKFNSYEHLFFTFKSFADRYNLKLIAKNRYYPQFYIDFSKKTKYGFYLTYQKIKRSVVSPPIFDDPSSFLYSIISMDSDFIGESRVSAYTKNLLLLNDFGRKFKLGKSTRKAIFEQLSNEKLDIKSAYFLVCLIKSGIFKDCNQVSNILNKLNSVFNKFLFENYFKSRNKYKFKYVFSNLNLFNELFEISKVYKVWDSSEELKNKYNLYHDYLRMCFDKNRTLKNLKLMTAECSSNVKERHDWLSRNIAVEKNRNIRYFKIWKLFSNYLKQFKYITVPKNTSEIHTWGNIQSHCLGSYASQVKKNDVFVIQVEDDNNFYHAMFEFYERTPMTENNLKLSQFYGKYNKTPPSDLTRKIKEISNKFITENMEKILELYPDRVSTELGEPNTDPLFNLFAWEAA